MTRYTCVMSTRRPTTPTLKEISQKLDDLAAQVERDQAAAAVSPRWWEDHAGRFENDPAFDEIMRLARLQRKPPAVRKRSRKQGVKRARA